MSMKIHSRPANVGGTKYHRAQIELDGIKAEIRDQSKPQDDTATRCTAWRGELHDWISHACLISYFTHICNLVY